ARERLIVKTDAADARLDQRHERVLLDPAAEVSGLGVAHDLTRVADCLQIAGDDFGKRARSGPAISTAPFCGLQHNRIPKAERGPLGCTPRWFSDQRASHLGDNAR